MQIIHAPTEIAGQMGIMCNGLRAKGLKAGGYNWFHSYMKYGSNNIINTDAYELAKLVNYLAKYSDIIHFHNGNTFLVGNIDLPYLHAMGKKMVMHHWGNDVRTKALVKKLNPYPLPDSYLTDIEIHQQLTFLSKYITTAIVQDYEVYPYIKDYYQKIHVLPLACNLSAFSTSYPDPCRKIPIIVHAPTSRSFKGTSYVEQAIAKLEQKLSFVYRTVENMSHLEALQTYFEADIIVDQLLCGTYGMLSVEAMAMGKVVVANIRKDVEVSLPQDLPIVNSTPETLAQTLYELIVNPALRHQIGKDSRKYVLKYHEVGTVTEELCKIYQSL